MTTVTISAGSNIEQAINANPQGTTFLLSAGVWHQQSIVAKPGDQFIGDSGGGTILTGDDVTTVLTSDTTATGVLFKNITVEHYVGAPQVGAIHGVVGWTLVNDTFTLNHNVGLNVGPNTTVQGGHFTYNGQEGISGYQSDNAIISGAEIAYNNTANYNMDWEGDGLKIADANNVQILNNYVHDNNGNGIWADINDRNWVIDGNTVTHNAYNGITYEISQSGIIRNNIVTDNGAGPSPMQGAQIYISSSGGVQVYGNTVSVPASRGDSIVMQSVNRSDQVTLANDQVHDNVITFEGSGGEAGWRNYGGSVGSGNSFDSNTYIVMSGNDAHFVWGPNTPQAWDAFRTTYGEETHSTLQVGTSAATGSGSGGGTPSPGSTLVLHVSGDQWLADPQFQVFVDGQQMGGTYDVSASHSAGQWQDIAVSGNFAATPQEVDVRFINDAWGGPGTLGEDVNLYVASLSVNGKSYLGIDAANDASAGSTVPNAAAMMIDGTLRFDTASPADTPIEARANVYPGSNGVAQGTAAAENIHATGAGQTLIGGGGDDIFGIGSHTDAKIIETGPGVSEVVTSAAVYTLPDGVDNLAVTGKYAHVLNGNSGDNVLSASPYGDTLNGGAGNDKLVIGAAQPTTLTGGPGDDRFVFTSAQAHDNVVTDFNPSVDTLDLSQLLTSHGYKGTDPVADHYVTFAGDGHGNTVVAIDPDGAGRASPHTLVTLDNVLPTALHDGGNWVWH